MQLLVVCLLYIAQKYMSFILKPGEKFTVVKYKGLQHVETTDTETKTFLKPTQRVSEEPGIPWLRVILGKF